MNLDDDLTEQDLDNLVNSGGLEERRAVAKHPNTSLYTLRYLAQTGLVEDVDQNPLLPFYVEAGDSEAIAILVLLAKHTKAPERLEELSCSVWDTVRIRVAKNKNTSEATLDRLANDKDNFVRRDVAFNEKTAPYTLARLAKDSVWTVRDCVAKNMNTPMAALVELSKDNDSSIRFDAKKRIEKIDGKFR